MTELLEATGGTDTNSKVLMISSDCHAGAPPQIYREYLDAKFRAEYSESVDTSAADASSDVAPGSTLTEKIGGIALDPFGKSIRETFYAGARVRLGGVTASWHPDVRGRELDAAGVTGEVIFPDGQNRNAIPFSGLPTSGSRTAELIRAGMRAHNRWLVDLCSADMSRHAGVVVVDFQDVEFAVTEIEWARNAGLFGGVVMPALKISATQPEDLWNHPRYEPIWRVCADLEMPLNVHVSGGGVNYGELPGARWINSMELFWQTHRALWFLIWSGVLERYPNLKVVITESGASWVSDALETMEYLYDNRNPEAARAILPLRPSEYWARQCFIGASPPSGATDVQNIERIGRRNLLWANDYPHVEGTWSDNNMDAVRELVAGTGVEIAEDYLGLNASRVYSFDQGALGAIASRIGPPRDLLSGWARLPITGKDANASR